MATGLAGYRADRACVFFRSGGSLLPKGDSRKLMNQGREGLKVVKYFFACRGCGTVYLFDPPESAPDTGRCRICSNVLYDVPMLNYLAALSERTAQTIRGELPGEKLS